MILDVFLFAGERRMLDARIATLADLEVEHVAVLANRTHQGDRLDEDTLARRRWMAHDAGASYVEVDLSMFDDRTRGGAGRPDYQVRERAHRDGAARAVGLLPQLVMLSDVDEIPRPEVLAAIQPDDIARDSVLCLAMRMHTWEPHWLYPGPWLGSTITTSANVRRAGGLQWMRDARGTDACRVLGDAEGVAANLHGGWHLSWWGNDQQRRAKLGSFSHAELAEKADELRGMALAGRDINGTPLVLVSPRDLDWPVGIA